MAVRGPNTTDEEEIEEKNEAEKSGFGAREKPSAEVREGKVEEERKHGGRMKRARGGHLDAAKEHKMGGHHPMHHPRKRGGKMAGKAPKHRPDRRARGGATSDMNPTTAAGNVSVPDYERRDGATNGGGKGGDNRGLHGRD